MKDNKKTCQQCNWEWEARKEKPAQCPKCKRYDWEKKEGGEIK